MCKRTTPAASSAKGLVGERTAKYGALHTRTLVGHRLYGYSVRLPGKLEEAKVSLTAANMGFRETQGAKARKYAYLPE